MMGVRNSIRQVRNFAHRVFKWNSMMLSPGWCVWHSDVLDLDFVLNRESHVDYSIWKNGVYDVHTIRVLNRLLTSEKVKYFFDIGANIGQMSCFAKNTCPDVSVVAFEPVWQNFVNLEMNKVINRLDISSECLALSDEAGETTLYMPKTNPGNRQGQKINMGMPSIILDEYMDQNNKIVVRTNTFDRYVDNINIDESDKCLFKIDVEGSELKVVRGMQNFINSHENIYIIVELNFSRNKDTNKIVDFLRGNGLEIYDMQLNQMKFDGLETKDENYIFGRPGCFPEPLAPFRKSFLTRYKI